VLCCWLGALVGPLGLARFEGVQLSFSDSRRALLPDASGDTEMTGCQESAGNLDALVVIPAEALAYTGPDGSVELETSGLVNPRRHQNDWLVSQILARSPHLSVEACQDERYYARVRVTLRHEAAARAIIKAIAREFRKNVSIREVPGTRLFESPREWAFSLRTMCFPKPLKKRSSHILLGLPHPTF